MEKPLSSMFSFYIAVFSLLLSPIAAQTKSSITIGESLTATKNSKSWVSPLGDFAFGFHLYSNTSNLFLLAIWYAKIPETVVWYANGGNPIAEKSTVTLTADVGLVLNDPKGIHLWNTSSEWNGTFVVSRGLMDDSGNFILRSKDDKSVWQSFDHPTDTLLPSQTMTKGGVLDSRLSESNYTKGRFQLRLQYDGNMVLNTWDVPSGFQYPPYYATGTYESPNQGFQLRYNESGHMYLLAKNGTVLNDLIPADKIALPGDSYLRATLNFYGVFTWYFHPKTFTKNNDVGWSKIYSIPDNMNICDRSVKDGESGVCGFNNICTYDDNNNMPRCQCPSHYSLLNPDDEYGHCKPDFELEYCDEEQSSAQKGGYELIPLQSTDWPFDDYQQHAGYSERDCKSSCLEDCFCAAVIFNSANVGGSDPSCYKKKLPLSNGKQDNSVSRTAWLKVRNGTNSTDQLISIVKNKVNPEIVVILGGSVFFNFCLLTALVLGIFFIYNKKGNIKLKNVEDYNNVLCFSYKALEEATNGFSEELGRGAFGVVYKGQITAGNFSNHVAVKKLNLVTEDIDKEFRTEMNVIGKTHHKNLVHLVGFCKEEDQRLLVYEYMSNGTLADYLFGDSRPHWSERVQISLGIAGGLQYLHEECSTQIIHCDIKPQNILLDEYQNARIGDFGLAKLLVLNQTHTNTAIRGTKGYVAPEWFRNKPVTVKVDVYSFGVILLEIICCRKNVCMELLEEEGAILTDWVFDCYQTNSLESLVKEDEEALDDMLRLKRFVMVGLWCIQEDPSLRPKMRMVVQMLEGLADVPVPPCPSFAVSKT
ncbi:G-type lectin S-receptor-like serine/threonine-protein kinase LECRK3 [Amaranthus tricolor]|uniref:G-type lectin S-receptor-like serine/threonine-protein kinase LECRK3 n=1 Tax=Amaranthus tricolor TaxID=29722 RepID=UPI00258E6B2A|nr:G-type lectin S-receptor-like serine/threonine-protein kinase LECRK3 [Amaranthus tricolor]